MKVKTHFITAYAFEKTVKVVKIYKGTQDLYMRLTNLYGQFRAIGANYYQITKNIKNNFSERKVLTFLRQLEKSTLELGTISRQVMNLTSDFDKKWLQE